MDADGHIIPIVEDDQGEGFKDPIDGENELARLIAEQESKLSLVAQGALEKGKTENEMLQLILDRLERIENQLKQIFDGHVLMNGQFIKF